MENELKIAELIGFFIGDGFAGKYGNHTMIQFVGNPKEEKEYYYNFLAPLIDEIFSDAKPHFKERNRGLVLYYYSKNMYERFVNDWGLPSGRKSYTVKIPGFLLQNNETIRCVIRGIFDAEGTVFWDKRKVYKNPYPRLSIQISNKELSIQLYELLKSLNFRPCWRLKKLRKRYKNRAEAYFVELYGESNLKKWVKEIYFSNNKHIRRLMPH
ncbi:hypothetical protein A3K63_03525 [Candidatus Micrarchaeota archaeon RBG_16_49_10]|nr:MAG: hypothetical protein A3K63_03525 [Candidatus Micrarchaeota archaeon RBG_16_49_10]